MNIAGEIGKESGPVRLPDADYDRTIRLGLWIYDRMAGATNSR